MQQGRAKRELYDQLRRLITKQEGVAQDIASIIMERDHIADMLATGRTYGVSVEVLSESIKRADEAVALFRKQEDGLCRLINDIIDRNCPRPKPGEPPGPVVCPADYSPRIRSMTDRDFPSVVR